MRVERIELNGFKSFADRTVFKFHPGTTAIVGPNGCGKSNIVDAFKWVLGEQSAKSLRGGSMEDVIFSGSATKKTKGMAEVTLVLSDIIKPSSNGSDNSTEGEMTEIAVTRRLYRSGESEYLMNKTPCRLKDIKNMFLDTGLELKAYSILEQGKIGDIINSKPQDRRFIIEEVAGVMKYKIRKQEATNKLEASKSNLQRIQDIIAEVKRQLNTIDRHAKKAERYKKLFEEIRDIDLRISKRDFKALRNEISELAASEDDLKSRESEASAHVHSAEAEMEEKKRMCVEHERSLNEIRTNLYSLEREIAEDEGKIALLKNECENMKERLGVLKVQDRELDNQKEINAVTLKEIEQDEEEIRQELEKLEHELEQRMEGFTGAESEIRESEQEIEELRRRLFQRAEEISSLKNEISHITLNIENINRKTEKNSQDINSLNDNLSSLEDTVAQTGKEYVNTLKQLEDMKVTKAELAERLGSSKSRLSESEETLQKERVDLASMESRLESLREQDSSQMSSMDENIRTLCRVADIVESRPEYETAIEAILGDKLGAAVVEDIHEIKKALRLVKESNTKRSGFITLNPPAGFMSGQQESGITQNGGVIGEAERLVSVKQGYEKVASSILKDVYLVDSLGTAFNLWEQHNTDTGNSRSYFVTLDGDVLEPSGMVFGGTDKGVLKIKRFIKELEQSVSEKQEKIKEGERTVATVREEIVYLENETISIDANISSQEKYCHQMEVKVASLEEEGSRLRKKHEYISTEISDDHREKEALESAKEEKLSGCGALEEDKFLIEENIRSVQNAIAEKRENLEKLRSDMTEAKVELTSKREKMSSIKKEIERLYNAIIDIDRKKEQMQNESRNIDQGILNKENQIREKEESLKAKIALTGELQGKASEVNEILESSTAELSIIEKKLRELASELEGMRNELNQTEMKKMEKTMKLNYMKEDIHKTYAEDLETLEVSDFVEPEEEEKLPKLKEKLQSIGSVSMGTLDEFEELKSRYDFLVKQRDDLEESIKALEETIRKINKNTQQRLTDAFNAINEKFKEVFNILFGKGKAELRLTEGSILEAGIDIVAQPPGKKLQNMHLLSGGEKALTAISLLFAGFMIKPTPLCLLDEVDAPLDESNTVRFINLLKELSKDIQFITITHNRRTMEAADYIYGITMEEPGSSKTVSMHLAEAV